MDDYVELKCNCVYTRKGKVVCLCEDHRYITCAKCKTDRAQITPIGVLCPNCTF